MLKSITVKIFGVLIKSVYFYSAGLSHFLFPLLKEVELLLNGQALTANSDDTNELQSLTVCTLSNVMVYLSTSGCVSRKLTTTKGNGTKSNFLLTRYASDGCGSICQPCKFEGNSITPCLTLVLLHRENMGSWMGLEDLAWARWHGTHVESQNERLRLHKSNLKAELFGESF